MGPRAFVAVALVVCSCPVGAGQSEVKRVGLEEQALLERLVEQAAAGTALSSDAWLKWLPHFFRGRDGKTYVPFTLRVDEAPGGFGRAAMYVRIAPRGDPGRAAQRAQGITNAEGIPPGEFPVNSPDRRQGAGAPSASDSTLMLRSLTAKGRTRYPYEAIYGVSSSREGDAAIVRRSFAIAPGQYDVYIALMEQERRGGARRQAILKQQITVPDMAAIGLRLSSVVVADRIETLARPLNEAEQLQRPYALGTAELVPASDDQLGPAETLHVAFIIYGAEVDAAGMPDVRVEYRLFRREELSERLLGSTPPQNLDRSTLPAGFDLRAGQQLASLQSLPLASYSPGAYRLVIRVVDNRSGAEADQEVRFAIAAPTRDNAR